MPLRIVFCGTPAFGLPSLRKLLGDAEFHVAAIITQPDRPRGRGQKTASPPAIKEFACEEGLPIFQPEKIKTRESAEFLRQIAPDAIVIIAYGQIISRDLLAIPRLGWINLHASLLPKYRGAAPVQRAISNGETRTGLSTMKIDAGLDTGAILEQVEMEVGANETAPELMARMAETGAPLIAGTLCKLNRGEIEPKPQDETQATLAPPLQKEEGLVNWTQSAREIYNRIRALQPWPGTYSRFRGRQCHLWGHPSQGPISTGGSIAGAIVEDASGFHVACGQGTWLRLTQIQSEGRKRMTAREFANGARLAPGERFSS